ncbi:CYTH and CHAD domain-containing protein [Microbispora sp. RL4-1S]|uniref:CYTH and CHAD domain-containing protein n=1 Tax=Microbispora oryzae TaxID=2806554 RepID=A0A940WGZ3_9ACTN|nr:CYTH and CHAD domain-containing protein [Microbispora oryzae]MBP2705365.1 CYTH and CHAD domain-containing protein [Microbispora oryzae]
MPIEIEDKFDVPAEFAVPDLAGVKGCADVYHALSSQLVAIYFDTPDLRLAARGVTLRRRRGGEDAGWHLKLPRAKGGRKEIQFPLTRSAKIVPAELAQLVLAYTRGAPLAPVAQLETRRGVTKLLGSDETVLVEVADDRVKGTVFGDEPVVRRWREVEAELKDGGEDVLRRVSKRLRKAGATPSPAASKLARLLGEIPIRPQVRPEPGSAGEAVVGYLRSQVNALAAQDPQVRLAEEDAVHQARVASRRLRSALKAFRRVVPDTEELQGELKWLGEVLGEARDLEVIRARLAKRLDGLEPALVAGPVRRRLGEDLLAREQEAYGRIRETLSGDRYFALLDALDALVADPPLTALAVKDAAKVLPKIVDKGWSRVVRAYDTAQALEGEERETAMHEVRKAAKRARYTAEAVGMDAKARRAETVQEVLGRHQDGVVAQEVLLREAETARQAGEDTFTYGVLAGIERMEAIRAHTEFPAVWASVT